MQGDYQTARALNEESLEIFQSFGDVGYVASAMRNLGNVHSQQGNHAAARALYDESLGMCKQLGDRSGIAGALCGLGVTARHASDASAARMLLQQSLAIYRDSRRPGGQRLREDLAAPMASSERPHYDRMIGRARAAFRDAASFERAWQKGRATTLEDATAHALEGGKL